MLSLAKIEKLEKKCDELLKFKRKIHIELHEDNSLKIHAPNPVSYSPFPTCNKFHEDKSFIRVMMGAFGSGKTSACCNELIRLAANMPPCKDGIRRFRAAIIRNTYDQLKKGSFDTWKTWFNDLGDTKSLRGSELSYYHKFNDDKGRIEMEIWFIALDSEEDVQSKLRSLNITFAFVNELSEAPVSILSYLAGRVGRYPKADMIDKDAIAKPYKVKFAIGENEYMELESPYYCGIIADTNPPEVESDLYNLFEVKQREGLALFKQPAGLIEKENGKYSPNLEAENVGLGLAQTYYMNIAQGQTKEFINVYCMGRYGTVIYGDKVYPQYNDDIHSVDDISVDKTQPLILSFDTGECTPAALIMQFINGQLRCIQEFSPARLYLDELLEQAFLPILNSKYQGIAYEAICDPSTHARDMQLFNQKGLMMQKAITNDIDPRIKSVVSVLNKMTHGEPALVISRKGCPNLRKGFLGKYCYKKLKIAGESKGRMIPEKTHPWSDIHDCLQYGALQIWEDPTFGRPNKTDLSLFINNERF